MDMQIIGRFIYQLEQYLIVIIGLVFAIVEIRMYIKYTRVAKKLMFAAVGLYWSIFYMGVIFDHYLSWNFLHFRMWTRAGILFTLSILCGQALNKWWRLNR
jgi:uncharacterized membrane protein